MTDTPHWEDALEDILAHADLAHLNAPLAAEVRRAHRENPHGHWARWQRLVAQLPPLTPSSQDFTGAVVRIGAAGDGDDATRQALRQHLLALRPWRKGPFELFGVPIDSEWRADRKWARLAAAIHPLDGRRVLDVGGGCGYYLWRMRGAGAALALGIDPTWLYVAQFHAIKRYCPTAPLHVLPLTAEQFPTTHGARGFDTVFSMGVLSHRRDPLAHLKRLFTFARGGAELVVETLVMDGRRDHLFTPPGRYAGMRNIHALPSALTLEDWLCRAGGVDIRLVNIHHTTVDEQRTTEWMPSHSLGDFLDPDDPSQTIEGHPAPQRGIFVCRTPE